MKQLLDNLFRPVVTAVLAIALGGSNEACGLFSDANAPSRSDQYTAAQEACVGSAKSKSMSCECRKLVDHGFGLCEYDTPVAQRGPNCDRSCGE